MATQGTMYGLAAERAEAAVLTLSDHEVATLVLAHAPGAWFPGFAALAARPAGAPADLRALGATDGDALRLAAALEAGARYTAARRPRRGQSVLNPDAVAALFPEVVSLAVECFWTVTLNVRGNLIGRHLVAQGSVSQCPVSPRDAFAPAVREQAHGVVLVHNHPSGDPYPSLDDRHLTERLRAAGEVLGLVVRDHVIVASGRHFSFVTSGLWGRS